MLLIDLDTQSLMADLYRQYFPRARTIPKMLIAQLLGKVGMEGVVMMGEQGPWKSGHGGCGHDGSLEKWAWRVWS